MSKYIWEIENPLWVFNPFPICARTRLVPPHINIPIWTTFKYFSQHSYTPNSWSLKYWRDTSLFERRQQSLPSFTRVFCSFVMSWRSQVWNQAPEIFASIVDHVKEWYTTHPLGQYALAILLVFWGCHITSQFVFPVWVLIIGPSG